jgi:hypothetical protein
MAILKIMVVPFVDMSASPCVPLPAGNTTFASILTVFSCQPGTAPNAVRECTCIIGGGTAACGTAGRGNSGKGRGIAKVVRQAGRTYYAVVQPVRKTVAKGSVTINLGAAV